MKHLLRSLASVGAISLAMSSVARAQDVYNFYFQKSGAPNATVNGAPITPQAAQAEQGVTPASAAAAPAAPSATIATNVPAQQPKDDFRHWQANIAWGTVVDHVKEAHGPAFGGEYAFNKYLGLQGEIMTGKAHKFWSDPGASDAYNTNRFAAALGVKLTPIHIQLFGWTFIELSAIGGVMSTTELGKNPRVAGYAGFGAAVNLSESTSVIAQYKFEDADANYGHAVTGFGVRF